MVRHEIKVCWWSKTSKSNGIENYNTGKGLERAKEVARDIYNNLGNGYIKHVTIESDNEIVFEYFNK